MLQFRITTLSFTRELSVVGLIHDRKMGYFYLSSFERRVETRPFSLVLYVCSKIRDGENNIARAKYQCMTQLVFYNARNSGGRGIELNQIKRTETNLIQ